MPVKCASQLPSSGIVHYPARYSSVFGSFSALLRFITRRLRICGIDETRANEIEELTRTRKVHIIARTRSDEKRTVQICMN